MKKLWQHIKSFWRRYVLGITVAVGGIGLVISLQNPTNSYDCTQPIKFTVTNGDGYTFSDALHIPQAECEAKTDADIAQLEQDRFNNWITTINSRNGDFSPTIENIADQLDTQNVQTP